MHYGHYDWQSSVICNVIKRQGTAIWDVSWKDTQWHHMMVLRERAGGRRWLPLVDPNPTCINMSYIDSIFINSHYTSTVLRGQLLKLTTVLQGHRFHLQRWANGAQSHDGVSEVYPVFRAGFYPYPCCWITILGVALCGWWTLKTDWGNRKLFLGNTF